MELTTEISAVKSLARAEESLRRLAQATVHISSVEALGLLTRLASLAHPLGFEGEITGGSFFTDQLVELRDLGYLTFGSGVIELTWQMQD